MRGLAKAALTIAAVLAPLPAGAASVWANQMRAVPDWVEIAEVAGPQSLAFRLDEDVEVRPGRIIRVWNRMEFAQTEMQNGRPYRSMLILTDVDCARARGRTLAAFLYEEPGLEGAEANSFQDQAADPKWERLPPGSTGTAILQVMCKLAIAQAAAADDAEDASEPPPQAPLGLMGKPLDPSAIKP